MHSKPQAFLTGAIAAIFIVAAATPAVFASGGGGGGGFGQDNGYQARVDRLYETGKSVYYARNASGSTVSYCINSGGLMEPVSRSALKSFAGTSAEQLRESLVRCDDVNGPAADHLAQNELDAVVYYLNKRYRLSLYKS